MRQIAIVAGLAAWVFRASPGFAAWVRQTASPVADLLESSNEAMGSLLDSVFAGITPATGVTQTPSTDQLPPPPGAEGTAAIEEFF